MAKKPIEQTAEAGAEALERSPNELNHGGFPNRVCL